MGSLKDEKRGLSLGEDHQPPDKSDNKGHKIEPESSAATEGQPLHMSQELTTQEDHLVNPQMNTSSEARDKNPTSKDQELSVVDGETTYQSVLEQTKDCTQTDVMPLTPKTTAKQSNATVSVDFPGNGDAQDRCDRGKEAKHFSVPLPPSTPDSFDPLSPAPFGQHHMRTQVSLEMVQCHSVATSPMTPPEDSHSFFFPSTFGKTGSVATATKDAELQVGKQVEFSSVATSPMTPKTPSTTAFLMLVGGFGQDQETKSQEAESEMTESYSLSKPPGSPSLAAKSVGGTCEDINPQCKQQRMGSMDQDITILVTQYGNNEEEEEKNKELRFHSIVPEMIIDEYEKVGENNWDRKKIPNPAQNTGELNSNHLHKQPEEPKDCSKAENINVTENKGAIVEPIVVYGTKPPESSAPFGYHNIHTQVSLEVVQCHSVATSPMSPPEGDQAFYFPSSFGKGQAMGTVTKDAEMQVCQLVEFCSVATAPMTPRTPTATTFPEIKKETSVEGKIVEEEKVQKEQVMESKEDECKEEEKVGKKKKVTNCKEIDEEKCEEPVQEVSWDEKGMTWEVYGAVVEVAVLGSAIQKHLEKQVMKQKQQFLVPPADPSESDQEGSGKGLARKTGKQDGKESRRRRNPFRVLMENVQQPHCCSRDHSSE